MNGTNINEFIFGLGISNFVMISITLLMSLNGYFTRSTLLLGHSIDSRYVDDERVKKQKRVYRNGIIKWGFIFIIAVDILLIIVKGTVKPEIAATILPFIFLIMIFFVHVKLCKKIGEYIRENNLEPPRSASSKVVVSPDLSRKKIGYSRKYFILYLIPIATVIIFAALSYKYYKSLPADAIVATHFGFNGPDKWGKATFTNAMIGSIVSASVIICFLLVNFFQFKVKQMIDSNHPAESVERFNSSKAIWIMAYALSSEIIAISMGLMNLITVGGLRPEGVHVSMLMSVITIANLLSIVPIIAVGYYVGISGERMRIGGRQSGFTDTKNTESHWYLGGLFYYNPDDPATLVPKRIGIGYTINVATPMGKFWTVAVIVVIFVSIGFAVYSSLK